MMVSWRDETLHYTDDGSGDVVLFLHGLGGNANNWLHQRTSVSRHHRVITFDLPGHGRSSGRSIGFDEYAAAAEAVTTSEPTATLLSNADGQPVASAADAMAKLVNQMTKPVRWVTCVRAISLSPGWRANASR